MSDYKHKEGMGSLFPNKYKEKENQPDHKGTMTDLNGQVCGRLLGGMVLPKQVTQRYPSSKANPMSSLKTRKTRKVKTFSS